MNKKITAVAIGALVVFGLTSCGSSNDTATPTETVTKVVVETVAPAPATDVPTDTVDVAALPDAVRLQDSWFTQVDDATIIDVATSICGALQGGASIEDIATVAGDTIGLEHAPAIIAGAIVYICPDQSYKVGS